MKPRIAYRLAVLMIPVAAALTIAAAVAGLWWVIPLGLLMGLNGVVNVRNARRRGAGWNGPATFRELRELERRHGSDAPAGQEGIDRG
ncbi:MAG TPA: hypothetical protein VNS09_03510 [Solirubrobacter sp.]|nr:hypothetical protein [Solirubrobacter sp.]